MRPRDWFSVGLRLFGVWVFYQGFGFLVAFVAARVGLFWQSELSQAFVDARSRGELHIWFAIGDIGLALVFLLRAEQLTRWLFNEPPPGENVDIADDDAY